MRGRMKFYSSEAAKRVNRINARQYQYHCIVILQVWNIRKLAHLILSRSSIYIYLNSLRILTMILKDIVPRQFFVPDRASVYDSGSADGPLITHMLSDKVQKLHFKFV